MPDHFIILFSSPTSLKVVVPRIWYNNHHLRHWELLITPSQIFSGIFVMELTFCQSVTHQMTHGTGSGIVPLLCFSCLDRFGHMARLAFFFWTGWTICLLSFIFTLGDNKCKPYIQASSSQWRGINNSRGICRPTSKLSGRHCWAYQHSTYL